MLVLFESNERRARDWREVADLFDKYGDEAVDTLRMRVKDKNLSSRDRKHWQRILSKAKTHRRQHGEDSNIQRA